ncbi:MAG: carbohydrate ABC transporter permease [Chloroflexi bacterium]|nr:carbohydrate ABC transporter permease [Chloroflexota bacterium]
MIQRGVRFNVFRYFVLTIYASIVLFPIFWLASTSIKKPMEWITNPATWISAHPNLESFQIVLGMTEKIFYGPNNPQGGETFPSILPSLLNSLIISGGATILALAVGTLAAYSISRHNTGGTSLFLSLLGVRFLPPVVVLVPFLVIFKTLQIYGSHLSVMLAYTAYTVPYAVWLMRSFIDDVPRSLEEAAVIDGCSNFSAFVKMVLPLIAGGLAVTGLFIFILDWTEFFIALTLTNQHSITVGYQIYAYAEKQGMLYGPQSAGALLALIIPIVLGLAIQKYLVRGLTFGAIRG